MANTYTQIHIHFVFAVRGRQSLILDSFQAELYRYIAGIVRNKGHKLIQINGMPDHIHILIGLRPMESISGLAKSIKQESTKWINSKNFLAYRFSWQGGFGAFSCSKRELKSLIEYIQNQKEHHQIKSFRKEYKELLSEAEIDYEEKYIFNET